MFGEKRSDGYEGTWYVLEANSRDGDHLLNKSPHDDGRGVWVHVSRLTEHGSKKAHATKKSTKAAKHERAMEKMRALRPVQERRNPAELSPIALVTEIRQAEFALRRNPSAEKQRYLDELLAEERSRESRYG